MELKILELGASHAFGVNLKNNSYTTLIDEYEFHLTDLSNYNVLVITYFIDQEYLYKHKNLIEKFLDEGKVVVFCGHLFRAFLPGCSFFMPKKINSYKDYIVEIKEGSPIFKGVDIDDMVYNKKVAGFFARGYYYPPKGAEICLTFTDGKVISYIDRISTKGTIIVHGGRNILSFESSTNTTKKISENTFELLKQEILKGENLNEKDSCNL